VVGPDRPVSLDDKTKLPYTNAVLMESMRMATIVPMALPHTATEDIDFKGYTFPKDTIIFANILHVHFDPKYWKNPDDFDPTRFYDESTKTFKTDDHLIPFSVGKRYCLGQSLAEKEYFLFFTGLLQKFTFLAPENGANLPAIGKNAGTKIGILRGVPIYELILEKRSCIN
jgi:cytochrome P450